MPRKKQQRPHIKPGEPWADQARSDLTEVPSPEWQALLDHALATAGKSKPPKRWLSEGDKLIAVVGRQQVEERLICWLDLAAELPRGKNGPRESFALLEGDNGDILRGLIWAVAPRADGALAQALGRAARTFAAKVTGLGQRSTRVTNGCVTALALAATTSSQAAAELLALQWAIDYPSTRAIIDRAIADLCSRRGVTLEDLQVLAAGSTSSAAGDSEALAADLERAEAALGAGKTDEALAALLAAWRSCRAPRLAELVEQLSTRLAGAEATTLSRKTQKATLEAWVKRARKRDPADVGILIDPALFPLGRDWAKTHAQLTELAAFEPDPRVAAALTGWILKPPFDSASSRKTWRLVLEELVRHDDPRSVEQLSAHDDFSRLFAGSYRLRDWIGPSLERVRAQLSARHSESPIVPAEHEPVCQRLDQALTGSRAGPDPDELLAAILADPDDDQLRLVYADLLQQQGDPRGELITLQLLDKPTRKQRTREHELLRLHARAWLGELEPMLQRTGVVYRRGFPAEGRLAHDMGFASLEPSVLKSPAWATFEALDLRGASGADVGKLVRSPALRRLRELCGVTLELARKLGRNQRQPRKTIEVLTFATGDPELFQSWLYEQWDRLDDLIEALANRPGLPGLRRLGVSSINVGPRRLAALLSSGLETLEVTTPELDDWQSALPKITGANVSEVVLREHQESRVVRFALDPKSRRLKINRPGST